MEDVHTITQFPCTSATFPATDDLCLRENSRGSCGVLVDVMFALLQPTRTAGGIEAVGSSKFSLGEQVMPSVFKSTYERLP